MSTGAGFGNLLLLVLPLLLLGFLFISQRRRTRDLQTLQTSLEVGDQVLTSSGIHARIVTLDGDIAVLEIAPGVQVRFDRRAVMRKIDTPALEQ